MDVSVYAFCFTTTCGKQTACHGYFCGIFQARYQDQLWFFTCSFVMTVVANQGWLYRWQVWLYNSVVPCKAYQTCWAFHVRVNGAQWIPFTGSHLYILARKQSTQETSVLQSTNVETFYKREVTTLRPCLLVTFLSVALLILSFFTFCNVMCEQHQRNAFNQF